MSGQPAGSGSTPAGSGFERLYVEKTSGAHRDRPELKAALEYMRPGDTLVVWRLSRLARSLKQIIETAHELEQKKQALKVGRKARARKTAR